MIDRTLAALADPNRRRALELLGNRPSRAGALADTLGLSAAAMSKHLKVLREADLVEETHPPFDARVRIYSVKTGALAELRQWIVEADEMWGRQLAAFKRHVEREP